MAADTTPAVTIAFLGPFGTYSHQAVRRFTSNYAADLYAKPSIQETVHAGVTDHARAAQHNLILIPFVNNVQGPVLETFASMSNVEQFGTDALLIVDEVRLSISHSLIVRNRSSNAGSQLKQIKIVRSHPQALGQCSHFLASQLGHAKQEATQSTADAVASLAADDEAAIGSELSAELSNTEVLLSDIQNSKAAQPDHQLVQDFLRASREARWTTHHVARTLYRLETNLDPAEVHSLLASYVPDWSIVDRIHTSPTSNTTHLVELERVVLENDTYLIPNPPTQMLSELRPQDLVATCLGTWRAPA